MAYLRRIQLFMLDSIFDDKLQDTKIDTKLREIARLNQSLVNANTPTFMFESKWYPLSNPHPSSNRELHESFMVEVNELINHEAKSVRNFKAAMSSLISNVLSVARHTDDLYSIFPKELTMVLPVFVDANTFNIGPRLSPEEIAEINLINADNLTVLHVTLMNNLLCARVV